VGIYRQRAEPDIAGISFAVEDTGTGIAPEDLPHVFERFWQKHREGGQRDTGLGLAVPNDSPSCRSLGRSCPL
jgi:signal transduction histidine kinase